MAALGGGALINEDMVWRLCGGEGVGRWGGEVEVEVRMSRKV